MVWFRPHTKTSVIWTIAILCLLAVLPSTRAQEDDEPRIADYFDVASGDEAGSCDEVGNLDDVFQEALAMSNVAFDSIDRVTGKVAPYTIRRSLYMLFGVDTKKFYNGEDKLRKAQTGPMKRALDVYGTVADPSFLEDLEPRLYCDSSYLKFTKYAYDEEKGEETDIPITDVIPDATDGAYWNVHTKEYVEDPESAQNEADPCDLAEAFTSFNSITLCPSIFGENFRRTLVDVKNDQSSIGESAPIYNSYKAVSGAFLHELTHLLFPGEVIDQPAFDQFSQPVSDTRDKSYGFNSCTNLAFVPKYGPMMAANNADTYHIFAMMMYLDEWDWASGVSEPYRETPGDNKDPEE